MSGHLPPAYSGEGFAASPIRFWHRETLPTNPQGVVPFWTVCWWDDDGVKFYIALKVDPDFGVPVWGY